MQQQQKPQQQQFSQYPDSWKYNQVQDTRDFTQMETWRPIDDRNRAAVMLRGPNTSLDYYNGVNFQESSGRGPGNVPYGYTYAAFNRSEPIYVFRPASARRKPGPGHGYEAPTC
jgi:hypothetical protein